MGGNNGNRSDTRGAQWAHSLGKQRHGRDELADETAKSRENDTARSAAVSAERWIAIVAGINRLVDAYNAGAGRAVLTVEQETGSPAVTIATGGGGPSLTATLEDSL